MRLPADATLIVAGTEPDGPAGAMVAALIAAWRAEGLPIVHVERSGQPADEPAIRPFDRAALHERLNGIDATTTVFCGGGWGLFAAALAAGDMGCHVFVARDACWPDALLRLATFQAFRPDRVRLVDCAEALAAVPAAKARQRRVAARGR